MSDHSFLFCFPIESAREILLLFKSWVPDCFDSILQSLEGHFWSEPPKCEILMLTLALALSPYVYVCVCMSLCVCQSVPQINKQNIS